MFDRLEIADITCPQSTPANAPAEVPLLFPVGILKQVTVVIPDGHSGLTGLALGYAHTPVWPRQQPAFLSGNDEVFSFPYKDLVPGVAWSAFLVNLDLQSHRWQVRFAFDEVTDVGAPQPVTPISTQDILDAGATILAGP